MTQPSQAEWMHTPVGGGPLARRVIIGVTLFVTAFFLLAPLVMIIASAFSLGANDLQILRKVIFPAIFPAFLAGCSLAFARCLGEFGAVIFIAGNQPMRTEIVALLTFIRLSEFDYEAAAVIATIMLIMAFIMLIVINSIQSWHLRYIGRGDV